MAAKAQKEPIAKYRGYFVAIPSFTEKTVIAYGKKPDKVYEESAKKGVNDPVVVFVPKRDTTFAF